jgi:superfamily I DNA and/or RNA helicase
VVAGDSRQLPPTDFFRRSEPEASGEDEIDSESILEICARSFGTVRRLKWHYRSRCESLIAFSNREFYRDALITFPNSRPDAFAIDLVRVDGLYRNRRNPDEAAICHERRCADARHHHAQYRAARPHS